MYQQYFGFNREPFTADIAVEQLFTAATFKELRLRFDHLCTYRGIMLLTGASGAGKTTAVRSLLATLNRKTYLPVYLPLSTVSVTDFYRQLNAALGGDDRYYKSDIYRSIQEQIINTATGRGLLPVIVLDEAHLLKEQNFRELQIITNFKMDTIMPAVFILVGQPWLTKRLQAHSLESFHQRISLGYELGGLSEEETKSFIKHHLSIAGRNDRLFEDQAVITIFQLSRGLPRLIGSLAKKSLLLCASKSDKLVAAEDVLLASKEASL